MARSSTAMAFNHGLARRAPRQRPRGHGVLGINVGANKTAPRRRGLPPRHRRAGAAGRLPDGQCLSPNCRLRDHREHLTELLAVVAAAKATMGRRCCSKSPPTSARVSWRYRRGGRRGRGRRRSSPIPRFTGRPVCAASIAARPAASAGGLEAPATAVLAAAYRLVGQRLPLIGVGGIASGADAYARIAPALLWCSSTPL